MAPQRSNPLCGSNPSDDVTVPATGCPAAGVVFLGAIYGLCPFARLSIERPFLTLLTAYEQFGQLLQQAMFTELNVPLRWPASRYVAFPGSELF